MFYILWMYVAWMKSVLHFSHCYCQITYQQLLCCFISIHTSLLWPDRINGHQMGTLEFRWKELFALFYEYCKFRDTDLLLFTYYMVRNYIPYSWEVCNFICSQSDLWHAIYDSVNWLIVHESKMAASGLCTYGVPAPAEQLPLR